MDTFTAHHLILNETITKSLKVKYLCSRKRTGPESDYRKIHYAIIIKLRTL